MNSYIALLRAVNVGGTGKLPMTKLADLCKKAGSTEVRTYLNSGNVIFKSEKREAEVKSALESALEKYAGKPVKVLIRTAEEMAMVSAKSPFADKPANKTVAFFLGACPPQGELEKLVGQKNEEVRLGNREIYVYYPEGIGQSKLKIPAAGAGTARNMNTVAKLAEMAACLAEDSDAST